MLQLDRQIIKYITIPIFLWIFQAVFSNLLFLFCCLATQSEAGIEGQGLEIWNPKSTFDYENCVI